MNDLHVHALDNLHVDLDLLAEAQQLTELLLRRVAVCVIRGKHLCTHVIYASVICYGFDLNNPQFFFLLAVNSFTLIITE